jgi:hypothetical protein
MINLDRHETGRSAHRIGYIYDVLGKHGGEVWIKPREELGRFIAGPIRQVRAVLLPLALGWELDRFMAGPVRQARQENREVRITDGGDLMIYNLEKSKLVWPN